MPSSVATQGVFVGRSRELARIETLWSEGERLITLVGPGGIGKTRLALEVGQRFGAATVVVCQLGETASIHEVVARVGVALGLEPLDVRQEPAPALAIERIGRVLSEGAPLLILDELERLVELAPSTVRRWLESAPELRCLVTSRRALGLDEEVQLELPPLTQPEGVELFMAQARRTLPGWTPSPGDEAYLAELVDRLDGLPLAIKLCAARATVLSPREMLSRLAARFDLLDAGRDDPVTRHRSLQAVLDDSWELLAPAAREALARCAVFRGTFTLEAAGAVLAKPSEALDLVQALREHSLVRRVEPRCAGDGTRFALDESVRSYAAERLESLGQRAEVEARAAGYYHGLAARLGATTGSERATALATLRDERDNVLAALAHLVPQQPEAVTLLVEIADELLGHEWADRQVPLLDAAVDAAERGNDRVLLARALIARAETLRLSGRLVEADASAARAQALAEERAAGAVAAAALRTRGEIARARGDAGAGDLLERARGYAVAAGERRLEGHTILALVSWHYVQRSFDLVVREAREAYAIWAELGEPANQALALQAQGVVLLELDRLTEARPILEEALAIYRPAGQRRGEGRVTIALAELAWAQGRVADALVLARRAVALHQAQSAHPWLEMALAVLALIEVERGRPAEAVAHAQRAEVCMGSGEYVRIRVFVQACRGVAEAARGAVAAAAVAFDAARATAADLEPVLGHFCYLAEGMLGVARALRARAGGDHAEATFQLAHARARLDASALPAGTSFDTSFDLRAIARLLTAAIAAAERDQTPSVLAAAREYPAALRIGAGGCWFSLPAGGRVEIERGAWRLVFAELARQRLAAPGEGVTTDELFAAGWPGERAVQHAARNRVWVALSGLRKLGLDALIVRRRGRYLIDPSVAVELAAS